MPTECAHTLSSSHECHPRESEPLVLPPVSDKCAILVELSCTSNGGSRGL